MKHILYILFVGLVFFRCTAQEPTTFSEEALHDTFVTLEGNPISLKDILETYKGHTLLIDIWASWCSDCIKGMAKVKALQQEHSDISYIFLSLDRTLEAWKKGIKKYNVTGNHYFMQSGWKGPFGTYVALDWIPRYMVVDKEGNIKLYKAVEADDQNIKKLFID